MTQADSTHRVLGRSLERESMSPAQPPYPTPAYSPTIHGTVAEPTLVPPEELPRGWSAFYSRQGRSPNRESLHWYATAPWFVDKVKSHSRFSNSVVMRQVVGKLESTVQAESWDELKLKIEEQNQLYDSVMETWREDAQM